jgi:hypothetical protein
MRNKTVIIVSFKFEYLIYGDWKLKKKYFTVFSGLCYKKRKEKRIDAVYVKEKGRKEEKP